MPALAGRDSRDSAVLEFDERGGGDKRKTVDYSFRQDVLGYTNVFLMFTWLFGCLVNRTHTDAPTNTNPYFATVRVRKASSTDYGLSAGVYNVST